jgi:ABC-2 type transport system permease protein
MKKIIELLKAYLLDTLRTPIGVFYGLIMVLGVFGLTGFVLNQGTTAQIVASYSVFIASYAAISAVAYSITGEKEKGLYRMYRSSRLSKREYVAEKVLMASLPLLFSALVIVIGALTAPIKLSFLIIPVLLVSVLAHSGLGLIAAAYFENHSEMQKAITIFLFAMIFLAPVFYTPEKLPETVQMIQKVVPLTYGVNSMRTLMVDGGGLAEIQRSFALLTALATASFAIGYRKLEY